MIVIFFQYPYNRKGECNVDITIYKNQTKISRYIQIIPFDTTKKIEDIISLQTSKCSEFIYLYQTRF